MIHLTQLSENLISMSLLLTYLDLPKIDPYRDVHEALIRVLAIWDCLMVYGRDGLRSKPKQEQIDIVSYAYLHTHLNGERRVREFTRTEDYEIMKVHWDLIWSFVQRGW